MSFNVPWTQPYPGLAKHPTRRLTVEIPVSDANSILSITLNSAILATICQYAIKHTAATVRKSGIDYSHSPQFLDYICKRTYSEFDKDAVVAHERGTVEGVFEGNADVGHEPTGVGKEVAAGRKGKGGTSAKKGGK